MKCPKCSLVSRTSFMEGWQRCDNCKFDWYEDDTGILAYAAKITDGYTYNNVAIQVPLGTWPIFTEQRESLNELY